jgi:3-hydroxybutyryl-CoA dehydrogenase
MEKLSIIGCGTMGHSIALSAAWAGMEVRETGINEIELERADRELENKIQVMMENGLVDKREAGEIRSRIELMTSVHEAAESSTFIIEAIPEVIGMKQTLYADLEQVIGHPDFISSKSPSSRTIYCDPLLESRAFDSTG